MVNGRCLWLSPLILGLAIACSSATQSGALRAASDAPTGGQFITLGTGGGPAIRVERLAQSADLLVSEVIDLEGMRRIYAQVPWMDDATRAAAMAHQTKDHLTPEEVGKLATRAGVGAVVLTHLVPGSDGELDPSVYLDGVKEHFSGPVTLAADLDRF